jgi:hypothetical protein
VPFTKPRYLPGTVSNIRPPDSNVTEFLVVWEDLDDGAYATILGVFANHRVKVLLSHSFREEKSGNMVAILYGDTSKSDASSDEIKRELKSLKHVNDADFISGRQTLFENFLFPQVSRGNRWMLLRVRTLASIEESISRQLGTPGNALMFSEGLATATEGQTYPGGVLATSNRDELLRNTCEGLRACGWGIFSIKVIPGGYEAKIEDPPVFEGAKQPGRFLCGVVAGIIQNAHGTELKIDESWIDPRSGTAFIRLSPSKS